MSQQTIYVDTSTLKQVAFCEKSAKIRYDLHWTSRGTEQAALICGSALHQVEDARQQGAPPAHCLALLEAEYKSWADANLPGDDVRAWANLREIVEVWLELYPVTQQPFPTIEGTVERGVKAALDEHGDVVMVGRLDKLVDVQGSPMIDDFKHTAMNLNGKNKERWIGFYNRSAQGPAYVWMTQQELGVAVLGMHWSVLSVASLPNSTSKCKTHNLPYKECRNAHLGFVQVGPRVYGEFEMDEWRQAARHQAKRWQQIKQMDAKEVPATGWYTGKCNECQFRAFCQAGSPWDMLGEPLGLVKEPWEPYQHAFGEQRVEPVKELPMVGPTNE